MTIRGADADSFGLLGACLRELLRNAGGPDIVPAVRDRVRAVAAGCPVPQ
jgi:hypothetical protein